MLLPLEVLIVIVKAFVLKNLDHSAIVETMENSTGKKRKEEGNEGSANMARSHKERNLEPFFRPMRVLLEFNQAYRIWTAQCLETGSVITADSSDMAKEMIKELLEDEISYAIEHRNLKNLYSSPAPIDIWTKWFQAAKENEPEVINLNVSTREIMLDDESETQVTIAQTAA